MRLFNIEVPVTIVMSTYNAEDTVAEAIESILDQTYRNWELIIIDVSTDNTMQVIQKFKDSRIKVYHYERRLTLGRARGIAVEKSTPCYRYVAYIDADDLWYPDHLEVSAIYLNWHPFIGFVYTAMRDEVNGVFIPELDRPELGGPGIKSRRSLDNAIEAISGKVAKRRLCWEDPSAITDPGIPPATTWMHRKVIFKQVGNWHPYRPIWEDGEFLQRVAQTHWAFHYIDKVTAWYRPRPESLSQRYLQYIS